MCDVGLKRCFSFDSMEKRDDVQMSDPVNGAFRPAAKSTTVVTGDDRLRLAGRFPADVRRGDHFHHRWITVFATPSAAKMTVRKTVFLLRQSNYLVSSRASGVARTSSSAC